MGGKPPKAARGGAGGEDLDSGAASNWDLWTKMIQEKGKRVARAENIDDFSGTSMWCFNFMKREGLSMRT